MHGARGCAHTAAPAAGQWEQLWAPCRCDPSLWHSLSHVLRSNPLGSSPVTALGLTTIGAQHCPALTSPLPAWAGHAQTPIHLLIKWIPSINSCFGDALMTSRVLRAPARAHRHSSSSSQPEPVELYQEQGLELPQGLSTAQEELSDPPCPGAPERA